MTKIIGYSTINSEYTSELLTGMELAKQDLVNHFNIRKGEKWTDPEFGSNLPFLVFQPLDESTILEITEDVRDVVSNDPRFEVDSNTVNVKTDEHYITVIVRLIYLPTTTATELQIKFDKDFEQDVEF